MIVVREMELKYRSKDNLERETCYIDSPHKIYDFLENKICDSTQEHMAVLLLNSKQKLIGWHIASIGTMTETICHPREIYKIAIHVGATAIIIAHNHPSGQTSPSPEDITTTKRIYESGKILGIPLLDHIIVTLEEYYSMKENGYLN